MLEVGNYQNRIIEDYDLWARMIINGAITENLPEILVKNRTGQAMYKRRGTKEYQKGIKEIEKKLLQYGIINKREYKQNIFFRIILSKTPSKIKKFLYPMIRKLSNNKKQEYELSTIQGVEKRILDIIIAILGGIVCLPLILIVAIAIKIDSKGKIIYKQKRIGLRGKEFEIYKFRTMIRDAEKETGPVLASKDDKRITKVGKILRKAKIDEIPQIINVLKGEMSIVGPRPERPELQENIVKKCPEFILRTKVKPGITGLATIEGGYYMLPEEKIKYDKEYMKNWNLIKDIKIIIRTFIKK